MKEYALNFLVQEAPEDPFDSDSDLRYRGLVRCKALGVERIITKEFYTPEEVVDAIALVIGDTEAAFGRIVNGLDLLGREICTQITSLSYEVNDLDLRTSTAKATADKAVNGLADHQYNFRHKIR